MVHGGVGLVNRVNQVHFFQGKISPGSHLFSRCLCRIHPYPRVRGTDLGVRFRLHHAFPLPSRARH